VAGSNCNCSTRVCVGFNVTGKLPPTSVKPAPLTTAEFTVTGDVPVDVSVSDCVVAVFTATLPKLSVVALIDSCGFAAVPVPLRVITAELPVVELLLIVSWPLAVPAVVGSNCTCSVKDWVGLNVTGKVWATIVKPAPAITAEFTVTDDVPVEVRVNDFVVAVFNVTLPKLRVAALIVNWGLGAAVLVPLSVTIAVLPVEELLLIVSWPLAAPVVVGSNCTCSVSDCVGFRVAGRLAPTIVNPAPVITAEFTVTEEVPVEVRVNDFVVAVFTVTLPKFNVAELIVNWGLGAAVLVPLRVTTDVLPVDELLLIVSWPLAVPVVVGSNCTCNVSDCVGFNVAGKLLPTIENPAPLITAEFTVTGDVPVDVRVNDCVVAVFTVTLPKLSVAALIVNWGLRAAVLVPLNVTAAVLPVEELLLIVSWPLAAPVVVGSNCTCSVNDCVGFSVAGKLAPTIVNPAPLITAELTVTGEVPVEVRVSDCVVAVFTVTLPKLSVAALIVNWGLRAAVLVPLNVTAAVLPVEELLLIVNWPLAAPVVAGSNCTCNVSDCVGFSVAGKLPPTIENPAPLVTAELTVTGEVPVEVRVSDCVVAVFTVTLPKLSVAALIVNWGLGAAVLVPLSVTVDVLPVEESLLIVSWALAVPVVVGSNCTCSVKDWVGFSVAGKLPPTIENPVPLITAEFTVTGDVPVEVRVSDCVVAVFTVTLPKLSVAALNVNWGLGAAVLVPLRITVDVLPVEELLLIVNWPFAVPVVVGSNCTCSVRDCVGFNVAGKLPPKIVNPVPVITAEFTVTGDVPVEVRVRDCVVAVFTVTLPKLNVAALIVSWGLGAAVLVPLSVTTAVLPVEELLLIVSWPLAAPVVVGLNCTCSVSDCVGLRVAGKLPPTIVNPVPLITAEFTVTGDVPVEVRVNDCDVAVFTVTLPKLRPAVLTDRIGVGAAVPVPLSETAAVLPFVELLLIVSWPAAAPVLVGLNCTCKVTVCDGFSVIGKAPPTTAKPEPAIVAEFTVTGAVPVDCRVTGNIVGEFTVTLPKFRLAVLTVKDELVSGVADIPVPLSATTAVPPLAELLLIVSCPFAVPLAAGLNCTCSVAVCDGLSVIGKVPLVSVKPVPAIAAEFTVTGEVPFDVSVRVSICVEFTVTLPKSRVEALNDSPPPFAPCPCMAIWPMEFELASIIVICPE
jgi:hypothetical protein